jgi:hypothetical protein
MAYSGMTIVGNGSSTSGSSTPVTYSYSESYSTVYVSSTTYKISISANEGGQNVMSTAWILKSGSVVAIDFSGQNLTGSQAQSISVGLLSGFILQIEADQEINFYTGANYFHSTGTSTVTIGTTQVDVTDYAANSLPVTYNSCGSQTTLTAYSFSVGVPKGASNNLVTSEHFAGSDTYNGQTSSFDDYLQVTSITLAS